MSTAAEKELPTSFWDYEEVLLKPHVRESLFRALEQVSVSTYTNEPIVCVFRGRLTGNWYYRRAPKKEKKSFAPPGRVFPSHIRMVNAPLSDGFFVIERFEQRIWWKNHSFNELMLAQSRPI